MVKHTLKHKSLVEKDGLLFDKAIISSPQHPIPTKDLVRRLQQLAEELSTIDQENPDFSSFDKIKQDLVNPKLIRSSNPGVLAYVCCSLSDILRIYAPEAPFTPEEISLIFRAFFNQFKKLSDVSNPYFQQQCYLLKRLAEVKSVVLITDVKDSEDLIELAFDVFYDLSNKEFPQRLEHLIIDILSEIMVEAEIVPHNVLKMVLDKLLTAPADITVNAKITNPGFNFSVGICEANIDRMSRQVAQYFSEMLYETSHQMEVNRRDGESINPKTLEALKRIHKLSIQIWRYVPGLLVAVMGLIDEELNADDETIRVLATESIGQMIGCSGSPQNFIIGCKETWNNWLKKVGDISPIVRCKWVEQIPSVIRNLSNLITDVSVELCKGLNRCLLDADEKVRLVSCTSIDKIPFDKFTRISDKETLSILTKLIREKNADIRKQAIKITSNLYNQYTNAVLKDEVLDFGGRDKQESDELEFEFYRKIPSHLLSLVYINDKEINSSLDIALFEFVFPFEQNDVKRVDRLCQLFGVLDDKSRLAFFAITNRQKKSSDALTKFAELCEDYAKIGSLSEEKENVTEEDKKSTIDKRQNLVNKLDKTIKWFSDPIPDSLNSVMCMERFYKLKNFRFIYLLRQAICPTSDFVTVKNSIKELLTKLSNPKNIRVEDETNNVSITDMVSTFKLILYRSSMIMYNQSNIVQLLNHSKNESYEWNNAANEVLKDIAISNPAAFGSHVSEMVTTIKDSSISGVRTSFLEALQGILNKYPDIYPVDDAFDKCIGRLCTEGTPLEAKYAVHVISFSPHADLCYKSIRSRVIPLDTQDSMFLTHLFCVAEILTIRPLLLEDVISDLGSNLIKEVLLINKGELENDTELGFVNDSDLFQDANYEQLAAKVLVLRLFCNRLISLASNDTSESELEPILNPIMKLFITLIINGGEIVNDASTPKLFQLKLRLCAGLNLVELSKISKFESKVDANVIEKLIFLVQDVNVNVRREFLKTLQAGLSNGTITEKLLPVLFYMNNEPNAEIRNSVQTWIRTTANKKHNKDGITLEKALLRLIHSLAHNSEFKDLTDRYEAYCSAVEVLFFYFNNVLTADNISLLYYLVSRVKQFRDATIDQALYNIRPYTNEVNNLYCVAEVSQLIIKEFSEHKNWPTLSWPGKVQLPGELFTPMLSTNEAHAIVSRVYIPDDIQIKLRGFIRQKWNGKGKRKYNSAGPAPKRTKAVPRNRKSKTISKASKSQAPKEPTRKSSRTRKQVNYGSVESDEEEEEMEKDGDNDDVDDDEQNTSDSDNDDY